jgi:hypothetical protein
MSQLGARGVSTVVSMDILFSNAAFQNSPIGRHLFRPRMRACHCAPGWSGEVQLHRPGGEFATQPADTTNLIALLLHGDLPGDNHEPHSC